MSERLNSLFLFSFLCRSLSAVASHHHSLSESTANTLSWSVCGLSFVSWNLPLLVNFFSCCPYVKHKLYEQQTSRQNDIYFLLQLKWEGRELQLTCTISIASQIAMDFPLYCRFMHDLHSHNIVSSTSAWILTANFCRGKRCLLLRWYHHVSNFSVWDYFLHSSRPLPKGWHRHKTSLLVTITKFIT